MLEIWNNFWPHLLFAIDVTICCFAMAHVVLHKQDVRAAIGWSGIIWLTPILGLVLYIMFGINRIERKAERLRAQRPKPPTSRGATVHSLDSLRDTLGPHGEYIQTLAQLVGGVTKLPLLAGNTIEPLVNGSEAYPAMIAAIDSATVSISLATYIFDNDASGQQFVAGLKRAVERGVDVRVIVDDVGRRYSWNTIDKPLRAAHIKVAHFLPTFWLGYFRYSNLRNHRKLLVIDGKLAFTGGMNIRHGNTLAENCRHPIQDMHYRCAGPVVAQMQDVFVQDWAFCTHEVLSGTKWFPPLDIVGPMLARGIADGPDETAESIRMTLLGAIAGAEKTIAIVTPYFVPDDALLSALNVAALRGIEVDVIVPRENNLRTLQWAMLPTLRLLLDAGCRVWRSAPPFDHSKILVVDGVWSLIGSANWDERSLRLNFEFNVEVYDRQLAAQLEQIVRDKLRQSTPLTAKDIDERNLLWRLRDGVARLGAPYL